LPLRIEVAAHLDFSCNATDRPHRVVVDVLTMLDSRIGERINDSVTFGAPSYTRAKLDELNYLPLRCSRSGYAVSPEGYERVLNVRSTRCDRLQRVEAA
jgi:hypothetical protein